MDLLGTPKGLALRMERYRAPADGPGERFVGYGVLGLPFASGHVLAFRRLASNPMGPPCTSVWHREPAGRWTFYVDVEPGHACPRYWGAAIDRVVVCDVRVAWSGSHSLSVGVPDRRLHWALRVTATPLTRALVGLGRLLPPRAWESPTVLGLLGGLAGRALGAGRIQLAGRLPNGQAFRLHPLSLWGVEGAAAVVEGRELGPTGSLRIQATLGAFPIPNRGLFAVGRGFHEAFDPARHSSRVAREGVVRGAR